MPKRVIIYTSNTCAYCAMLKKFLRVKSCNYTEINVDEHPEKRQEAFDISGAMTVPIVIIERDDNTKRVIVGYNLPQLAPALA